MKKLLFLAAVMCCAFAFTACDKDEDGDEAQKQQQDPKETEEDKLVISIQSNWSVALDGDPIEYEDEYYQFVNVTAPGIKYFWLDCYSDEEIKIYYGTVDSLVLDWEEEAKRIVKEMGTLDNYLWKITDRDIYTYYYDEGPYDIYIVEFDEKGNATGRIGITKNVTFPSIPESAPARVAARFDSYYTPVTKTFLKRK